MRILFALVFVLGIDAAVDASLAQAKPRQANRVVEIIGCKDPRAIRSRSGKLARKLVRGNWHCYHFVKKARPAPAPTPEWREPSREDMEEYCRNGGPLGCEFGDDGVGRPVD